MIKDNNNMNEKQLEAFNIVKNKQNLFLSGSAGTGKSFTIKKIVEYLNSFETPMFMRVVAKAMLSSKGVDMIEKMIDRAHGKAIVKADVKVETNVKQIFKIGNTEIEF